MRKIRQVLRLALEAGFSRRSISKSLHVSRDIITDYLTRTAAAGLTWPLPPEMDDAQLELKLFPGQPDATLRRPEPNWEMVHQEMKAKGATLQVLHQEFLAEYPMGIGYSLYCGRYRLWQKTLRRYMRQPHVAGERAFVDYAGPTMEVLNVQTGEFRKAQIFVGILGASNYTYAEAHWSQKLPNWIAAHARMFEFFDGVPQIVVCDNLKSAVTKASRTEPVVHPTYQNMAAHYKTVILPARPRKPKDKAKVENAVRVVERWILFRLRKRIFASLEELNTAIASLLADLNARPFQKMSGSRRSQYEELDRPVLKALPEQVYEYTEFLSARVGQDGCFNVDGIDYSAPHMLSRQEIDLRVTAANIEILHRGKRVASHTRSGGNSPIIDPQHLRAADLHFGGWDAAHALEWTDTIGPHTHQYLQQLLATSGIKEHGYRATNALKRMESEFGSSRLEAACGRANAIGATLLSSLRSILRKGLDKQGATDLEHQEATFDHPNVRGSDYYH